MYGGGGGGLSNVSCAPVGPGFLSRASAADQRQPGGRAPLPLPLQPLACARALPPHGAHGPCARSYRRAARLLPASRGSAAPALPTLAPTHPTPPRPSPRRPTPLPTPTRTTMTTAAAMAAPAALPPAPTAAFRRSRPTPRPSPTPASAAGACSPAPLSATPSPTPRCVGRARRPPWRAWTHVCGRRLAVAGAPSQRNASACDFLVLVPGLTRPAAAPPPPPLPSRAERRRRRLRRRRQQRARVCDLLLWRRPGQGLWGRPQHRLCHRLCDFRGRRPWRRQGLLGLRQGLRRRRRRRRVERAVCRQLRQWRHGRLGAPPDEPAGPQLNPGAPPERRTPRLRAGLMQRAVRGGLRACVPRDRLLCF